MHRGTRAAAPLNDRLLRDLYLLAEAAADRCAAGLMFPRLAPDIREARREAAERRPVIRRPSRLQHAAERLMRALLLAEPGSPPPPFAVLATPEESHAWVGISAIHSPG